MIELPAALDLDGLELAGTDLDAPGLDGETGGSERALPAGYYALNLLRLLDTVAERDGDLLAGEELDFVERLRKLGTDAQRLYTRLVMRKGPLFRRDLLDYPEIGSIDAAVAEARDAGLLDDAADAPLEDLLAVLRRHELAELADSLPCCAPKPPAGGRRDELVAALLAAEPPDGLPSGRPASPAFLDAIELPGDESPKSESGAVTAALRARYDVIRPLGLEFLWLFRLLFFGNLEQDWREFMLADLGVQRYEPYPVDRRTRLFSDRRAALETLELGHLRFEVRRLLARPVDSESLDSAVELARHVAAGRRAWHAQAWRHGERMLAKVARELERAGRLEESLELYAVAESPPCRERLTRVLARLGREAEALERVERIANAPLDAGEACFAPFFRHRLRRKLGLTQEPWRRAKRPVETLEVDAEVLEPPRPAVEWLTLALLEERGRAGVYSENWLWRSLFGLAFWDILFAPLPGVFAHPFQLGPLDLGSTYPDGGEFFRRRRARIEARLEELRAGDLESLIWPTYGRKHGTANAFVAWHPQLEESLLFALRHVDGDTLAAICERLARDPKRHRRGLPDLLVKTENGVELLEVKAPGDQLRPEQAAWIDYLNGRGVSAKVLRLIARPRAGKAGST